MGKLTTVTVNGFSRRLNLEETIQSLMAAGNYEPEQTAWVSGILQPGSRFVDVGANFGYFASLASSIVGPRGRVFAFEPSPIAQSSLRDMIECNHVTNIELCAMAVGDANGDVEILLPPDEKLHSPSIFACDDSFIPCKVPMVALDAYPPLNDGRPIDLIKIDVEGFEPNVLAGMRRLIGQGMVRHMSCEFNSGWLRRNNGMTPAELLRIVLDFGFEIKARTQKLAGIEHDGVTPYELQDILFAMPSGSILERTPPTKNA